VRVAAVLLAAGQGTRMHSARPKVLHSICGKPMLWHVLQAVGQAVTEKPVIVVGHGAQEVREYVGERGDCVIQEPQLGTAHAAMQAESLLRDRSELVLVTYADMPLLRGTTFQHLVEAQSANAGPITMLTVEADDPRGFGRVVRAPDETVEAIVEEAMAGPKELLIHELNVGAYCFSGAWLWEALKEVPKNPSKGEYYLTDLVEIAARRKEPAQALVHDDASETIGINNRVHMAEAEVAMRDRINREHMLSGVSLADPSSTYIEAGVTIGEDTRVEPNTHILGNTSIGKDNVLGPNAIIRDSVIGNRCKVLASVMEGARLEDDVDIGPFARLRRGAHLASRVHMGNFGEVKDSYLGPGVKVGHFSYIGDATVGENTNVGAGTITCNYDGEQKHPTEIGEDVFIGSDTMLVAPIKIGDRARTGAGAVVTKDVPPDTLAVGMPARGIKKARRKGGPA
jgi:bifunctional UDP-N-acetylglucosamine pyrophosphorylase/glucosamine-1-phosphate N-acetyltransferase